MKTIMIDLDDTLVSGGYLDIINEYLNENHKEDELTEYRFESLLPNGIDDDYVNYYYERDVYSYTRVFDNAKEILEELNNKYDICICSAYIMPEGIEKSYIHLANKYKYLHKEFPFLKTDNFIFTSRKDLVKCDIKIDDRIDNLKGDCIKLLYTARHNKHVPKEELDKLDIIRVNNWQEIKNILLGD